MELRKQLQFIGKEGHSILSDILKNCLYCLQQIYVPSKILKNMIRSYFTELSSLSHYLETQLLVPSRALK